MGVKGHLLVNTLYLLKDNTPMGYLVINSVVMSADSQRLLLRMLPTVIDNTITYHCLYIVYICSIYCVG